MQQLWKGRVRHGRARSALRLQGCHRPGKRANRIRLPWPLQGLDFRILEFDDPSRLHVDQVIVMVLCAISLSSVMFVILDLSQPYQGYFAISSTTMRTALDNMLNAAH